MTYFLAGDIGGTKTLLQIFKAGEARKPIFRKSYPSAGYAGLVEILEVFFVEAGANDVSAACFALAAPVASRQVKLTNLPWEADADVIAQRFDIAQVSFINDFEAVGFGIAALEARDLLPLQEGERKVGAVRVVVGAGTGLGVAWLSWKDGAYAVHPSEGGHLDFSPTDELQIALLQYLQKRHGHVSYERIVSGPGLMAIYEFLRDAGRANPSSELIAAMQNTDGSAVLASFASNHSEPIAQQALQLFVKIYGAFVGNISLAALPRGGVYIAGGIAAKIATDMQNGQFMQAFLDKGRFESLLATLPVAIVNNPQIGLLGASLVAESL